MPLVNQSYIGNRLPRDLFWSMNVPETRWRKREKLSGEVRLCAYDYYPTNN